MINLGMEKRTYGYAESGGSFFTSLQLFWVEFLNLGQGTFLYVWCRGVGLLWLETKACGAFLKLFCVLERGVRVKKKNDDTIDARRREGRWVLV